MPPSESFDIDVSFLPALPVDLLTKSLSSSSQITNTSTDLEVLERSIQQVSDMLDRVLVYVRSVIAGKTKGDPAIGKYLLETFSTSTEGLDHGSFATSLQVSHDIIFLLLKGYLRIYRTRLWSLISQTSSDHKQKYPLGCNSLLPHRPSLVVQHTYPLLSLYCCVLVSKSKPYTI